MLVNWYYMCQKQWGISCASFTPLFNGTKHKVFCVCLFGIVWVVLKIVQHMWESWQGRFHRNNKSRLEHSSVVCIVKALAREEWKNF